MLLEVNAAKVLIALRPAVSDETQASFRRLIVNLQSFDFLVIIAESSAYEFWAQSRSAKVKVLRWISSTVSAVQGNVRAALDSTLSHPHMAICVCFKSDDVREAILTRCGTVQVNSSVNITAVPDVFVFSVDEITDALNKGNGGFSAEIASTSLSPGRMQKGTGRTLIINGFLRGNPELESDIASRIKVVFLGRYFSSKDQRRSKHQFSRRLYNFKNAGSGSELIASALGSGIAVLQKIHDFDLLTRIPPKPSGSDRVGSQLAEAVAYAIKQKDLDPLANNRISLRGLSALREWQPQKDLSFSRRVTNLKGAFKAADVHGKRVLVVDDILTSGASIIEAGRALFASGATEVCALVIGLTQRVILSDLDENLACPQCEGGHLQLRFRNDNGLAFWGCSEYFKSGCKGGMRWEDGLREFNRETRRERIAQISDIAF